MGMCVFSWGMGGAWNGGFLIIVKHGLMLVNMELVQMVFGGSSGAGFVGVWSWVHERFVRRCRGSE